LNLQRVLLRNSGSFVLETSNRHNKEKRGKPYSESNWCRVKKMHLERKKKLERLDHGSLTFINAASKRVRGSV